MSGEQEIVNFDFEGYSPVDSDHANLVGILSRGIFQGSHIDVSSVANIIIERNYISTVLKPRLDVDDDDDDDDDDVNCVFAVASVLNLQVDQTHPVIGEIRNVLLDLCLENAPPETFEKVKSLLENAPTEPIGLLINERIMNLPSQVCVPLMTALKRDMESAVVQGMPYNFHFFIVIAKIHYIAEESDEPVEVWINKDEEHLFNNNRYQLCFDFTVPVNHSEYKMTRKVMIVSKADFETHVNNIDKQCGHQ